MVGFVYNITKKHTCVKFRQSTTSKVQWDNDYCRLFDDVFATESNPNGVVYLELEFSVYALPSEGKIGIAGASGTFEICLCKPASDYCVLRLYKNMTNSLWQSAQIKLDQKIRIRLELDVFTGKYFLYGSKFLITGNYDEQSVEFIDCFSLEKASSAFVNIHIWNANSETNTAVSKPIKAYSFSYKSSNRDDILVLRKYVPVTISTGALCFVEDNLSVGEETTSAMTVKNDTTSTGCTTTAIGCNEFTFDNITSLSIKEGAVIKLSDKDGNVIWDAEKHKYSNAYGIRWKTPTDAAPVVERIGNIDLHKTLPIQTKFRTCIVNHIDETVLYADPKDRRFFADAFKDQFMFKAANLASYTSPLDLECIPFGKPDYKVQCLGMTDDNAAMFLWTYVKIDNVVYYCQGVSQEEKTLTLKRITKVNPLDSEAQAGESFLMELGFVTNGYLGQIMVDTGGDFYLWSKEDTSTEQDQYNEVWISETKPAGIDSQLVERQFISADCVAVKTGEIAAHDYNFGIPNEMWGYLGNLDDGAAICCRNFTQELRGGNHDASNDVVMKPIAKESDLDLARCKTAQAKPEADRNLSSFRDSVDLNGMTGLHYVMYKAIFWLYAIEYGSFNMYQDAKDNVNGLKKGGLGQSVISKIREKLNSASWSEFNKAVPMNLCLSGIDVESEYSNDKTYTDEYDYTSPKSYRGLEWLFNDRNFFIDGCVSQYSKYTDFEDKTYSMNKAPSKGYATSLVLGTCAELWNKSSTTNVTNNIGFFNVGFPAVDIILKGIYYSDAYPTNAIFERCDVKEDYTDNKTGYVQTLLFSEL